MARQQVIEIECSRCGRKEYLKPDPKKSDEEETVDLLVSFMGETVQLKDLCSKCVTTCRNYFEGMKKDVKTRRAEAKKRRSSGGGSSSGKS